MGAAALIPLIEALATTGITLFTQVKGSAGNAGDLARYVPLIGQVWSAIDTTTSTLRQAQADGWTDDDERWKPAFAVADAALAAAEARL